MAQQAQADTPGYLKIDAAYGLYLSEGLVEVVDLKDGWRSHAVLLGLVLNPLIQLLLTVLHHLFDLMGLIQGGSLALQEVIMLTTRSLIAAAVTGSESAYNQAKGN